MFSGPDSSSSVPAFVAKLWQMVCDSQFDDLIAWCDNGSSFVIKDQARFCSELLPMYYKHNNMASFIRQLNKYGFRKVVSVNSASLKGDMSDFEFCHPHFIRGCPLLLEQIKRKVSMSRDISELKTDQGLLTKLLLEVQQMQQKQSVFESRITAMKAENDALWREHSILRQKHQKQQKIVNRLIHFLLSLVHQTRGVNVKRRNMPLMLKDGSCLSIEDLNSNKKRPFNKALPIICEIDPTGAFTENKIPASNCKNYDEPKILVSIPSEIEENIVTDALDGSDEILLQVPSQSTITLPVQEESPSIILKPETVVTKTAGTATITGPINKLPEKRSASLVSDKSLVKVRKIMPDKKQENHTIQASSSGLELNSLNNTAKVNNQKKISVFNKKLPQKSQVKKSINNSKKSIKNSKSHPLTNIKLLDADAGEALNDSSVLLNEELHDSFKFESGVPNVNIFNNDYSLEEPSNLLSPDPIIFSPSGTQILSPEMVEEPAKEENNSLVLSDSSLSKHEVESHIDLMQSDIDALKEILHGEGLSLDASTIMGLFGNDDPISLNMPEAGRSNLVGNELVSYNSQSLADLTDGLEEDELPTTNDSFFLDEISSTLNTPQATSLLDENPFPSKPPRK